MDVDVAQLRCVCVCVCVLEEGTAYIIPGSTLAEVSAFGAKHKSLVLHPPGGQVEARWVKVPLL
eukprot:1160694-Pelagomonas_calceolata.AAC.1